MALLFSRRLLKLNRIIKTPRRYDHPGFIVLLPEIGEETFDNNLMKDGLPEFNSISIENCVATIGKQTVDFEYEVRKINDSVLNRKNVDVFEEIINPIEKFESELYFTWGLSKTLYFGNNSLMPSKTYFDIHERANRARAFKYCERGIIEAMRQANTNNLTAEQKSLVQKYILEGKLNALDVDDRNKHFLNLFANEHVREVYTFRCKLEVSTLSFSLQIQDPEVVKDFPKALKQNMNIGSDVDEGPWVANLYDYIRIPFLEYCPDRGHRRNVYESYTARGSNYEDSQLRTGLHVEEIRFLRLERAQTLGYKNFVELSMETKMVGTQENLERALQVLLDHAYTAQEKELKCLLEYAKSDGFKEDYLELWDIAYYNTKQVKSLYDYREEHFQEYFPLKQVLEGLFKLCEKLFNITIEQRPDVSTWHKDIQYFDVFEPDSSEPIGGFYFDPYARSKEKLYVRQNVGWMIALQNRSEIADTKPLSALIFNFQQPTSEQPSLLTFKDCQTLFQKFGQNLQHLLTRTSYADVGGLNNVDWDAIEVSGHMLSHWLFNKSTIDAITSHYQSGDKLPDHMFESLVKAQRHGAGLELCKEIYLCVLDLEMFSTSDFWLDIVRRLWHQYFIFPFRKTDSHPLNFSEIFIENYAGAYFMHLWARLLAADAYSAFYEVQNDEKAVLELGKRYRDTFLALGGSVPATQVFRTFRGRDPSPNALLNSLGIKKESNE